jgi:hypothetical protein
MKKVIQFVAWLTVALIVSQPVFAATSCALGLTGDDLCAPVCCTANSDSPMLQMGGGCHSSVDLSVAAGGCGQGACSVSSPQVVAQVTRSVESKMDRMVQSTPVSPICVQLSRITTGRATDASIAAAPARYLLLQVFRI